MKQDIRFRFRVYSAPPLAENRMLSVVPDARWIDGFTPHELGS